MKTVAVILAAGNGKRMGTAVKKQFLLLLGKPILFYSLKAFEESIVDEIVLVATKEDMPFIKKEIVDKYGFAKVKYLVEGGRERYNSVMCGINAIVEASYIFIHDGARPMIDKDIIDRAFDAVRECKACVVGMPSKDTVKIANENGEVASTPDRSRVWNVQTPQVFEFSLIKEAYEAVLSKEEEYKKNGINITDDAMILETYSGHPVRLVEGSYENIKVTTPDDLVLAECFLKMRKNNSESQNEKSEKSEKCC